MAKSKEAFNPFYITLVVLGIVFCVTACAYGVMAFRGLRGEDFSTAEQVSGLMQLMHSYGERLLAGELVLLAAATFAAMATDSYWQARKCQYETRHSSSDGDSSSGTAE